MTIDGPLKLAIAWWRTGLPIEGGEVAQFGCIKAAFPPLFGSPTQFDWDWKVRWF